MIRQAITNWLISHVANREPDFLIGAQEEPYLRRWWVIPRNKIFNIYLHNIRRSDEDRATHSHPWINITWMLLGKYLEHLQNGDILLRTPGSFVFRWPSTFHRLEVIPNTEEVWTLFITGPRVVDWFFDCLDKGLQPWQEFTSPLNKGEIGRGCD